MNIFLWIILGLVAGWIASMIMKTDRQQGTLADIVIGVIGAIIGGFTFNVLGGAGVTGFNLYSMFVAVIGSVLLLGLRRALS